MGCAHSKVDDEEAVRRSRERKRLMKHLMACRAHLAAAHLAYLRSLKNTGATLRQFTDADVDSLPVPFIPGASHPPAGLLQLPPSPPPLPPSPPLPPPPLPQFSPQIGGVGGKQHEGEGRGNADDAAEIDVFAVKDENEFVVGSCSPPPPPVPPVSVPVLGGSVWEFWDPFGPPSSSNSSSRDDGRLEEEHWAEANAEFHELEEEEAHQTHRVKEEEEEEEEEEGKDIVPASRDLMLFRAAEEKLPLKLKLNCKELADDNSSTTSLLTKDTDTALVAWRTKKSLATIVKEIDDYFLKAAAAGNDVLLLLESDQSHRLQLTEELVKGKSFKSAKVFSALSWNWSLKYPQSSKHARSQEPTVISRPTDHSATLQNLYTKEQRLYKEVKEDELVKVLHRKKTMLLQKLEARDTDNLKTEELRTEVENLHVQILSLQDSISETCLSISKLRDEELHPQLAELTFGLMHMWRTMYECHQVQNHISQQANLLDRRSGLEATTDSHRFATAQLETEVNKWYNSFCSLLKSQRDYVHTLNQWVGLTDCLPDTSEVSGSAYGIQRLCEEWQLALDRLPDKVAAEAIKSFLSVIHSIFLQQKEDMNLQKRSHRLESRLEKDLTSFSDTDKHGENTVIDPAVATKLEALKKKLEEEKSKYLNSVRNSRAMTLNNLQTGLPNVFQALMGFAGVCVQAFEGICQPSEAAAAATDHSESSIPLSAA